MKRSFAGLALLTLVAAVGCNQSKMDPSEPTAVSESSNQSVEPKQTTVKKPIAGEADATFSLSVPFESIALTQGEQKPVLIGINRGKDFREQVAIALTGLPAGVTLETADSVIAHGSMDATLVLKAAADASLGTFTVKVTGHTTSSGADFSKEFKVIVTQK
jgi:uncharacterized membrane protein